jgi:DNA-binding MarR family transcriptional regulator
MTDQQPIGYWLKLITTLIDEQTEKTLDQHGITRRQWQLLSVLARGGVTAQQLGAGDASYRPADGEERALDQVSELIDSAWVDATPTGYELTERGRGALERLTEVMDRQKVELIEGIAEENYTTTLESLAQVAHNLGWTS